MTEPALGLHPLEKDGAASSFEAKDNSPIDQPLPAAERTHHRPETYESLALGVLAGAPVWGGLMALSVLVALYLANRLETSHASGLAALYFFGGALAWPFAFLLGRFFAKGRSIETRFAAFFVMLTCGTLAMTAFLFAMEYRLFYARWHAPFGTIIWVYQFVFTSASAVYQFAILGMRLFLPFGLICLTAVSMLLAKRIR